MTKRNFKLLIILIFIILAVVFSYFFFNTPEEDGTEDTGTNFIFDLLPFGTKKNTNNNTGNETPADISGYVPPTQEELERMKLTKISSMPIAGYTIFNQERFVYVPEVVKEIPEEGQEDAEETKPLPPVAPETEFIPILRYVDIATGNIYQTFLDQIDERKFSDTTIPNVHEAFFGDNGNSVIMRYLKPDGRTISTFVGSFPKEVIGGDSSSGNEIKGSFLPENITNLVTSFDKSQIFYLFNAKDMAVGITGSPTGENKVQVFDSGFTEWLPEWPNPNMITVTTKASYAVPGYMYAINPSRKDFRKVMGDIRGLTTLTSPDGRKVLYSNNTMSINIYDVASLSTKSISIRTLAEKCVWTNDSSNIYCAVPKFGSNGSQYPDTWYQGEVSFSDDIWKINVESGTATRIFDPASQGNGEIDAIKLSLNTDGDYLFFVNKVDSYLWGLELR